MNNLSGSDSHKEIAPSLSTKITQVLRYIPIIDIKISVKI